MSGAANIGGCSCVNLGGIVFDHSGADARDPAGRGIAAPRPRIGSVHVIGLDLQVSAVRMLRGVDLRASCAAPSASSR